MVIDKCGNGECEYEYCAVIAKLMSSGCLSALRSGDCSSESSIAADVARHRVTCVDDDVCVYQCRTSQSHLCSRPLTGLSLVGTEVCPCYQAEVWLAQRATVGAC